MANSGAGIACVLLVACMVAPSLAAVYTVGDDSGWTTGADYTSWTKDKTFQVGDSLVFKFGSGHTVDEVSSSDYDSCTVGNAITSDSNGPTTVTLKTAGTHYYICGVIGHCSSGMKLAVSVQAAGGGGATTTPSGSGSSSSGTPSSDNNRTITTPATTTNIPESSYSVDVLSPFLSFVITWVAAVFALFVL